MECYCRMSHSNYVTCWLSHYSRCILRSIIYGEATKLRGLSEADKNYNKTRNDLKQQRRDLNFNLELADKIIHLARTITGGFSTRLK